MEGTAAGTINSSIKDTVSSNDVVFKTIKKKITFSLYDNSNGEESADSYRIPEVSPKFRKLTKSLLEENENEREENIDQVGELTISKKVEFSKGGYNIVEEKGGNKNNQSDLDSENTQMIKNSNEDFSRMNTRSFNRLCTNKNFKSSLLFTVKDSHHEEMVKILKFIKN